MQVGLRISNVKGMLGFAFEGSSQINEGMRLSGGEDFKEI